MGKFAEVIGIAIVCVAIGIGLYRMLSAWAKGIDASREEQKRPTTDRPKRPAAQSTKGEK